MLRHALLVVTFVSVIGCEGGPPVPDASLDASAPCERDLDCSDGVFCDGAERCVPGDPSADARGCVAGAAACAPMQRCDEGANTCSTICSETEDADGDGVAAPECGGTDCDDSDPDAYPGATEVCDEAGRDEDCDGDTLGDRDADGDGATDAACCNGARCGTDCDDEAADRRPGQIEACNEADDDCDGAADEGVQRLFFPDLDGDGYGDRRGTPVRRCELADGVAENALDCNDALAEAAPGRSERCALVGPENVSIDEDCDGAVDETLAVSLDCASRFGSPPGTGFGCVGGACVVASCRAGYADCDDELSNGCETDLTGTLDHCGMCGRSCGAGGECVGGTCDRVVDVAAGQGFTCARRERPDGTPTTTVCWGANDLGQLGDGTTRMRTTPVTVAGVSGAVELAASAFPTFPFGPTSRSSPFACARNADEIVFCWGSNESGQLGRGWTGGVGLTGEPVVGLPDTSFDFMVGRDVRGTLFAMDVGASHAVTFEHTMMMDPRDRAQLWGGATSGATATSTATATTAIQVDRFSRGVDVAAGGSHTCFLEIENCPTFGCSETPIVTCIGSNNDGHQLGTSDTTDRSHRMELSADEIDAGMLFTCARRGAQVRCWGSDVDGELGDGTAGGVSAALVTVLAPGSGTTPLGDVVQISAGRSHACARLSDGRVVCWGRNASGQLGAPGGPRAVDVGLTDVVDVSAGSDHTCAVRANGEVWCWGGNATGQLGTGTTTGSPVPVRVPAF